MTNTHLEELLAGQSPAVQEEIIRINTEARPMALQIALLVPLARRPARPRHRSSDDAAPRPEAVRSGGRAGRLSACGCPQ